MSYEIDALQVMLPAAMRAKYEKFIIVEEPEQIEDEDFKRFLAGQKTGVIERSRLQQAYWKLLKSYVKQGIVTVDTAVSQQTAMKKVRMIRMADDDDTSTILESIHPNAKKQAELIRLDDRTCRENNQCETTDGTNGYSVCCIESGH